MDDLRIGAVCRALRRRMGWRQSDLAAKAGVHQTTVSRIERGQVAGVTVASVRRVFAALGARYEPGALWRGGELDRLLDERHAALGEAAAGVYLTGGWRVIPEATYSEYGERGSIDLFAGHDATRIVAVNEVKSDITSVEETHRRQDAKVRLASRLAVDRFGWQPTAVARILIVPEDSTVRRTIDRHAALFDAAYPARTSQVTAWIRRPEGPLAGIWFLSPKPVAHARPAGGGSRRVVPARTTGNPSSAKRAAPA